LVGKKVVVEVNWKEMRKKKRVNFDGGFEEEGDGVMVLLEMEERKLGAGDGVLFAGDRRRGSWGLGVGCPWRRRRRRRRKKRREGRKKR